jgi:mRNA interferase RelE/StbE
MRLYLDYKILISKRAQKFLDNLDLIDRTRIVLKVNDLTTSSVKILNIKKLQGYKNLYRLRVDDFRVIYAINDKGKLLIVAVIGLRKDIYSLIKRISL